MLADFTKVKFQAEDSVILKLKIQTISYVVLHLSQKFSMFGKLVTIFIFLCVRSISKSFLCKKGESYFLCTEPGKGLCTTISSNKNFELGITNVT